MAQNKPAPRRWWLSPWTLSVAGAGVLVLIGFFLLPKLLIWGQRQSETVVEPFPVTVYPQEKRIVENPIVNAQLSSNSSLTAAVIYAEGFLNDTAMMLVSAPWYGSLAGVIAGTDIRFVTIDPGYRKEQVVLAFAQALGWNEGEKKAFLAEAKDSAPALTEGTLSPGTYIVESHTTPAQVQAMIVRRFQSKILARYATSTAALVPLDDALTIASMIERESSDMDDMRIISGIMWNRLFTNMRLQIDATVQYAKANATKGKNGWWPIVRPRDLSLASPYNTYRNAGLPPDPISNPSVAAVLAALNPKQTSCLFYFHDRTGGFHCSDTYATHVALLKKYYGQGK